MTLNPSISKSFAGSHAATEVEPGTQSRASRLFVLNAALGGSALLAAAATLGGGIGSIEAVPSSRAAHLTLLGATFSRPRANYAAVALLTLVVIASAMVAAGLRAAARGALAGWRFRRAVAAKCISREDDFFVFDDAEVLAFCAGLLRPQVYVSTGALRALSEPELDAVLAHERHHARRRDPLRIACGRVIGRALFLLPVAALLHERHCATAELAADDVAIGSQSDGPRALAAALLAFTRGRQADGTVGIAPERVDHLVGRRSQPSVPSAKAGGGLALLALIIPLALLLAQLASAQATLGLPFLSARPCIVVMGLMAVTFGALGLAELRRRSPTRALRD
jgi:Zn-dependent protease with chaperone function